VGTQGLDFAEFYRSCRDECLRAVLACVGDPATAQDLVDEAFAHGASLNPWLTRPLDAAYPIGPRFRSGVLTELRDRGIRDVLLIALRLACPLGRVRPNASPRPSSKPAPSTAARLPKRLVRPPGLIKLALISISGLARPGDYRQAETVMK